MTAADVDEGATGNSPSPVRTTTATRDAVVSATGASLSLRPFELLTVRLSRAAAA